MAQTTANSPSKRNQIPTLKKGQAERRKLSSGGRSGQWEEVAVGCAGVEKGLVVPKEAHSRATEQSGVNRLQGHARSLFLRLGEKVLLLIATAISW